MVNFDTMEFVFWLCLNAALISVAVANIAAFIAVKKMYKPIRRLIRSKNSALHKVEKLVEDFDEMSPILKKMVVNSDRITTEFFGSATDHENDLKFPNDEK